MNLQEAQRAFEQALAIDPRSVDARVGIGMVLGENLATGQSKDRKSDLARADQVLCEALEYDRNNPEAHAELGRIRRIQGRLLEAQIEFEKALVRDRNNTKAIIQLAITLIFLGKPNEALPTWEDIWKSTSSTKTCSLFIIGLVMAICCWDTSTRR